MTEAAPLTLSGVSASDQAAIIRELKRRAFVPHGGGQKEVMASDARFRILRAGRRWGKTQLAAHEVIMHAIMNPGSMVWWVANADKNVRRGYRAVLAQLPPQLLAVPAPSDKANDRILTLVNGSQIEFYTAGTPDALAGEGVDFLVVDEAALIIENVWFQLLRPTLSDTNGRALIISTPRGRNWFWKLWRRGEMPGDEYVSWHFRSLDNPYIDPAEIADAEATLPSLIFEQEYNAAFVENAASMFNLGEDHASVRPGLLTPQGWVCLGIDLAKKQDFTVVSGCNAGTRLPCVYERWNETSWAIQQTLIMEIIRDLENDPAVEGVTVCLDSTGVGDVVFDNLEDAGVDVVPVDFNGGRKERMVRLLASDLEKGNAFIYEEMVDEFEVYEYEITPNGRYKFEAADGHDDKVSAKILENWAVVHESPPDLKVADLMQEQLDEAVAPAQTRHEDLTPDPRHAMMQRAEVWARH